MITSTHAHLSDTAHETKDTCATGWGVGTAMGWNKPALVLCGTLDMGGCSQESWGSWKQC